MTFCSFFKTTPVKKCTLSGALARSVQNVQNQESIASCLMNCQHQPDAAGAFCAFAAAMASLITSAAQYLKYFKIDTKNYINANYHQKM